MDNSCIIVIDKIINNKHMEYFLKERKIEDQNKYTIYGNGIGVIINDIKYIITTYHFGGLTNECLILNKKMTKIKKVIDLPMLDISIFQSISLNCIDDFTYEKINETQFEIKKNDEMKIIGYTLKDGEQITHMIETNFIELEQLYITNKIFPQIPTIIVKHDKEQNIFGLSGCSLVKNNEIVGICSGYIKKGICCIPFFCILKLFNTITITTDIIYQSKFLNNIDFSGLLISTELNEVKNDDDNKIFYGLNIINTFNDNSIIKKDDLIIKIDNNKIDENGLINNLELDAYIMLNYKPHENVDIQIIRNEETINISVMTEEFIKNCSINPIVNEKCFRLIDLEISELDVSFIKPTDLNGKIKNLIKNKFGSKCYIISNIFKSENMTIYNKIGFPIYKLDNSIYYPIICYINGNEIKNLKDIERYNFVDDIEIIFELTPIQIIKIYYKKGIIVEYD